jgi:U3 small nucleolar RNA-associated protein 15
MGGFQPLHTMSNHAKTITCLTLDYDGTRLLSSSLDGHVKVYDLQVLIVHSMSITESGT